MYAAHRGRYTTLCMFWTAADVFKLRLDQGRTDEGAKILEALKRILPNVEAVNKELDTQAAAKATSTPAATSDKLPWEHDKTKQEGSSASAFIASATRRLSKVTQKSQKTPKDASPQGDNICDNRDICETEIKVLSDANQSNPSNPCSTADSSDSCSPIPINEQLTSNSRQLMLKEKAPKGNNLRDSQDFVSASEQATNNNSEEFAAYGTCLSKQINEELTANSRQLMLKEKAPKGNNLRDSQDFVSASEQATNNNSEEFAAYGTCLSKQINEELTANSRQLMLKEKAPKGNNLRDSQDFVSASEQATNNNSEEFAAYGTCLSKQINEELTANSRQLMLKEKAPKGNNLRDSQDFVSASEQATNNNSEEFAAYGTCLSKQINEELTANSRQLMLKEKAPKGNNLRDSQDFVSASEQATKESLQGKEDKTINSQLLHDYPGHLTVSLEDGIIRPIPGINAPQRIVLACITAHPGYSVPQISASTGIPAKSIERHVAALIDKNLIEHRGSKKTGGYYPL